MKRKCSRCKVMLKYDRVQNYVFESTDKPGTYWNMDLCFDCRDKILNFIEGDGDFETED